MSEKEKRAKTLALIGRTLRGEMAKWSQHAALRGMQPVIDKAVLACQSAGLNVTFGEITFVNHAGVSITATGFILDGKILQRVDRDWNIPRVLRSING